MGIDLCTCTMVESVPKVSDGAGADVSFGQTPLGLNVCPKPSGSALLLHHNVNKALQHI